MNTTIQQEQCDFVGSGFHRLDSNIVSKRPPRIKWGRLYKNFGDDKKISYLEKLASTMNHAAYLMQEERNGLLKKFDMQGEQIKHLKGIADKATETLQSEVLKMNQQKQDFNSEYAKLKRRLTN